MPVRKIMIDYTNCNPYCDWELIKTLLEKTFDVKVVGEENYPDGKVISDSVRG